MKNKSLIGLGLTAAVVAFAAGLVTAQGRGGARLGQPGQQLGSKGPGGRGPLGRGGPFGIGFAGLNLTEEQRSKVSDIQRAARAEAASVEEELRTTERSLHRELFADTRDAAKIADLSAKVSTLRRQLAEAHVRTSTAISDVLTAEQRASIRDREVRGRDRGASGFRHGPIVR